MCFAISVCVMSSKNRSVRTVRCRWGSAAISGTYRFHLEHLVYARVDHAEPVRHGGVRVV